MKICIPIIVLCGVFTAKAVPQYISSTETLSCDFTEEIIQEYRKALHSFFASTYRELYYLTDNHFVFSPLSAWIILAAIMEGAGIGDQEKLFQLLQVPKDPCHRKKFYQLATSRFVSGSDAALMSTRILVIDEQVTMNAVYHDYIFQNSLLNVVSAPLKDDPETSLKEMRRITSAKLMDLDISGNSVLLDTVDYQGLWSTAFEDAILERAPFYSQTGERLGSVDLMNVKRRARISHIQSVNTVALELPIGKNDRYRIIFGIIPEKQPIPQSIDAIRGSVIDEFLQGAQETEIINIAIPRMILNSEINIKQLLKGNGIDDLWTNPMWTKNISEPAALPSDFVQRTTLTLDQAGLKPPPAVEQPANFDPSLDPILTKDFIGNRPILFGFFDAETYTCIMSGAFTKPTYVD